MLKIVIAIALIFAAQAQLLGGFTNHPELISSQLTRDFVDLAVNDLATRQNIRAVPINVISVATQLVNGLNYRIVFNARSPVDGQILTCTAKAYQSFSGEKALSSVTCP